MQSLYTPAELIKQLGTDAETGPSQSQLAAKPNHCSSQTTAKAESTPTSQGGHKAGGRGLLGWGGLLKGGAASGMASRQVGQGLADDWWTGCIGYSVNTLR